MVKFDQMNKQSGPITSREDEKSLYININKTVPEKLAINMGTRENTAGKKKVQTY